MQITNTQLIRLTFSALEDYWDDISDNNITVSPVATVEEWKNIHIALSEIISDTKLYHCVVVNGDNGEVVFEQRERDGEFYVEFNGEFPQSDWTFTLTRSDARALLSYISDMLN